MLTPLFILAFTALTESSSEISSEFSDKHHQKCKANEIFVKCPDTVCVPKTCEEVGYPVPCVDLNRNGKCPSKPACICKEGYVRNCQGICIPMKECPSCHGDKHAKPSCGVHCIKRCCDYFGKSCPCLKICHLDGCDCKEGYYYDENTKKCVLPEKCTKVCQDNEVLSECANGGCDRRNCSQLEQAKECKRPHICKKGCVCIEGYLRNSNGTCLPISKCPPPKCGKNEIVSYCVNGECEKKDSTELGQLDISIDPDDCIWGCICKNGYLRNDKGVCVLEKKCPPVCGANEVYNKCLENVCKPTTCRQLGYPFACVAVVPSKCTEGCLCKLGYLRDDKGICIPEKSCPSCGGDPNAEVGCGIYCNRRCSDIGKKPKICDKTCNENTCDCKKGFYLDHNTGKCVSPKNCSHHRL